MKFTYWLSRILGSFTTFFISIFGLGVVGLLITIAWYLKSGEQVADLTNNLKKIIDALTPKVDGVPITTGLEDIVKTLTNAHNLLLHNATLIKDIANGVFIGSIVFASVFVLAIFGWAVTRGSYKTQQLAAVQRDAIQQHAEYRRGN